MRQAIPPPWARHNALCCRVLWASLQGQTVDELLALLGGIQACGLLRCAGAKLMLTSRRIRRGLVQDCAVVGDPVGRPLHIGRLPVSLLQLRCRCVPWHAPDRPVNV